jgi:hypothetical protein
MFYFDLYIINVYVILPPDLGPFAVNKYIHTYILTQSKAFLISMKGMYLQTEHPAFFNKYSSESKYPSAQDISLQKPCKYFTYFVFIEFTQFNF